MMIQLQRKLLHRAYISFACRRVNLDDAVTLIKEPYRPQSGDIVLARIKEIGQHKRVELANGRKPSLAVDDLVVLAYGNRYAPDQFEGFVPRTLSACAMVAAGGIAAVEITRNSRVSQATTIQPLGVLGNAQGGALNLYDYRIKTPSVKDIPPVLLVCGTSMNAGKTHMAASLIKGLHKTGRRIGASKLSGTGSGGDIWRMRDSGAVCVLDFTDAGYASTYLQSEAQLLEITDVLIRTLADERVDVIVVEIADGLSHHETRRLMQAPLLQSLTRGVFFAAGDAMSASAGVRWIEQWGLPLIAVGGVVTLSPLATRELCALIDTPVMTAAELSSPNDLCLLMGDGSENSVAQSRASLADSLTLSPGFTFRHDVGDINFNSVA